MLDRPSSCFALSADDRLSGSITERIRARLSDNSARCHANDNTSAFLGDGELDALVIDTASDDNTADTARRVAKMSNDEVFAGRYRDAPEVASFPNVSELNELMIFGPITVHSTCSHNLCPIMGRVWIGVLPDAGSDLIELSKYAQMAEWILSRPQIQEEAVVMEANHFYMHWRGV